MAKTTSSDAVADSNEPAQDATTTKVIAEWVGHDNSPRLNRFTAREITKKQAKEGLVMDITKDLRWSHDTNYRVDVSDQPEPFQEWLRGQKEFKVTEE